MAPILGNIFQEYRPNPCRKASDAILGILIPFHNGGEIPGAGNIQIFETVARVHYFLSNLQKVLS
jgi:hypothetical protein